MRCNFKFIFFILLTLFSCQAFAGKNPIAWQLSGSFQNPVFASGSYSVTYTFTNQLPVQLVNPLVIEKNASPANEFSYVDNCSGVRLTPQQSCTVQINLNPTTAGQKSVQLTIAGYSKDRVPVPTLTTQLQTVSTIEILGAVTESLPNSLTVGTQSNYKFTFVNDGNASTSNVSVQTNDANSTTTCTSTLAAGRSCTVSGTFTPTSTSPSIQTVSATFSYKDGSPVTVSTSTSIPAATGMIASFVTPYYLPAVMATTAAPQTIKVLFTNYGPLTTTLDPTTPYTISATGAGTLSNTTSNCTPSLTLTGNEAACYVQTTFTPSTVMTPTSAAVTATLTYTGESGSPLSKTTSTEVLVSVGTSRTITFVNNCDFPVWFSLHGGQLKGASCSNGAGCPDGTSCSTATGTGGCYWTNYGPTDNNYELDASGGGHTTDSVTIQASTADPNVQWSGVFSASLQCPNLSSGTCQYADCGNKGGTAACAAGTGFTQPATQAEITMQYTTSDSYDVEVINGFHVPISMAPGPYVTNDNYSCGIPGYEGGSPPSGFGSCDWSDATPPTAPFAHGGSPYYYVTNGGTSCSSSACGATQLCGLDSSFNQVCGDFLGFWTADQACGQNPSVANAFFNCNTPISGNYPSPSTLTDLMLCSPPNVALPPFNSCYLTYTSGDVTTCCGCEDWWNDISGVNSDAASCTMVGAASPQSNPTWQSSIKSTVEWLKAACPSSYVYPYDDKTSGFSCTNGLPGTSNSVGYTITFCPNNDTGLPPGGITDGRIP